jgi:hypothetical protein
MDGVQRVWHFAWVPGVKRAPVVDTKMKSSSVRSCHNSALEGETPPPRFDHECKPYLITERNENRQV